ncbi:MAG TPA: cytochrome c peroxidase [Chitinophagaceae bacterium]|nr:cytochrome c peroxidase [Chitinophagaceae bacterium]
MKNSDKILTSFLVIFGIILFSCNHGKQEQIENKEQTITDSVLSQVNTFYSFVEDTFQAAVKKNATQEDLQRIFLKSRILYKKFEWASTYFMGVNTQMVNGAPVPEVENADLLDPNYMRAIAPSGLQVIEELLFPFYDTGKKEELLEQLNLLLRNVGYYRDYFSDHSLADWRILDGAKLEIFRILTLGITGYDNPLTLHSMKESASSLKSLETVLCYYVKSKADTQLLETIDSAISYLQQHVDFNTFPRAYFITHFGNKISSGITDMQYRINGFEVHYNRLLNQDARTLFDSNAYNENAFTPGQKFYTTREKIKLGKRLFSDPHLSGTGMRSCASCHIPDKAFTDGLSTNTNIHSGKSLPRNTPTLLNVALQSNFFYDMRVLTLEGQAHDVLTNPDEMDGSMEDIIAYLSQDSTYQKLFSKAYSDWKNPEIDSSKILNALASYDRSLTKLNSRFDQFMRGDSTALSSQEIDGFNLFMGKAKCATCHFMPLFNGLLPPKFVSSEAEVIGVPISKNDTLLDPDLGWYNTIGIPAYKHAFKTTTVRNISRTAPYMHNGIYDSLEEVMVFYNNGGGVGMGIEMPNATLAEDSLQLTDVEIDAIIAFMKSLDSSR